MIGAWLSIAALAAYIGVALWLDHRSARKRSEEEQRRICALLQRYADKIKAVPDLRLRDRVGRGIPGWDIEFSCDPGHVCGMAKHLRQAEISLRAIRSDLDLELGAMRLLYGPAEKTSTETRDGLSVSCNTIRDSLDRALRQLEARRGALRVVRITPSIQEEE
jgi:hypothetical protein